MATLQLQKKEYDEMASPPPLSTIHFYSLKTTTLINVSSIFLQKNFFFLLRNQEVYIQFCPLVNNFLSFVFLSTGNLLREISGVLITHTKW